jgi:elongation factor Tu
MADEFKMLIANVYSLPDGPAVTGRIDAGRVRVGDRLKLLGVHGDFVVRVTLIQRFRESLEEASAGPEPVGISLGGVDKDQIQNRDLLVGNSELPQ